MINTSITPISYKDASILLNMPYDIVKDAGIDGRLTRLPTIGRRQLLIKEQVELFRGKKQIRFTMLSSDELSLWTYYKDLAEKNNAPTNEPDIMYSREEVAKLLASVMQQSSELSDEEKKISFAPSQKQSIRELLQPLSKTSPDIFLMVIGLLIFLIGIPALQKEISQDEIDNVFRKTFDNDNHRKIIVLSLKRIQEQTKHEKPENLIPTIVNTIKEVKQELAIA